jgi:integrase
VLRHHGVDQKAFDNAKHKLPLRAPLVQKHFKSMDWQKVPEFYAHLNDFPDTPARLCLQLVMLTAVRCAEARRAEHSHFSFETLTWTVPAELVKGPLGATTPHLVPLNDAVVSVVKNAMNWHENFLFPSPSGRSFISDVAMTRIIRKMGYEETVHGFRASFRDWAAENGEDFQCAEAQLHHVVGTQVTRAYLRTNLLERRRAMMARWASFVLNISIESNVSPLRKVE